MINLEFQTVAHLAYDAPPSIGEPVLTLLESYGNKKNSQNTYIKSSCLDDRFILCKASPFAIRLFFEDRLTIKELFMLRYDEPYIIILDRKRDFLVYADVFFEDIVFNSIRFGNYTYKSFNKDMVPEPETIFSILDMGTGISDPKIPSGEEWLEKYGYMQIG